MKNLFVTTAIVVAFGATGAAAQTVTIAPTGSGPAGAAALSGAGTSASGGLTGGGDALAVANTTNELAIGAVDGAGGDASAVVGDGVIIASRGNGTGGPNIVEVGIDNSVLGNGSNSQIQFQLGNNNQALNIQVGSEQESGTIQVGDDNVAFISQDGVGNEAASTQVGNLNNTALFQDSADSAAASAIFGDSNTTLGLQVGGPDNILAFAVVGDGNNAVTFQEGSENTASSVQIGDDNTSYINQGGAAALVSLAAIDGTVASQGLPAAFDLGGTTGLGALGATSNAAASVQVGTNNISAILQSGDSNEAVNFQAN